MPCEGAPGVDDEVSGMHPQACLKAAALSLCEGARVTAEAMQDARFR
jgi:hypothetical protein